MLFNYRMAEGCLATHLEPVNGAAVDERREHAKTRAEGVADWAHGQHDVHVLAHALREEAVHRERRRIDLTTLWSGRFTNTLNKLSFLEL